MMLRVVHLEMIRVARYSAWVDCVRVVAIEARETSC